ncbi:OB-fold domain-containing protein [uncultured Albimonas sp.]|uniref:Zn-ribbon domain-containing OB-fold protein n=1 Tax=uncultured Albimonas sp. TaxID=1331701 RepID=UPI0030EC06B9
MRSGILLQRCPACEKTWAFPRERCPDCGGAPESFEASGRATLFSATVVTRAPDETFRALAPYRIALADLEEGPRIMAHLSAEAPIGAPLTGRVEEIAGRPIPLFKPA